MCEPKDIGFRFDDEIYSWEQKTVPNYNEEVKEDDCIMTVLEFLESIESGGFIDDDGYGYPVKDGKRATGRNIGWTGEHVILPSKCPKCIPIDATHIVWYNS